MICLSLLTTKLTNESKQCNELFEIIYIETITSRGKRL